MSKRLQNISGTTLTLNVTSGTLVHPNYAAPFAFILLTEAEYASVAPLNEAQWLVSDASDDVPVEPPPPLPHTLTTDDLPEGVTNLYFTDARAIAAAGGGGGPSSTDALTEGSINLYFTQARVRTTPLTGLFTGTGGAVSVADTVLQAFGRLENRMALNDVKVGYTNAAAQAAVSLQTASAVGNTISSGASAGLSITTGFNNSAKMVNNAAAYATLDLQNLDGGGYALKIQGATSGAIRLGAPAAITDYAIVLPDTPGTAGSILYNGNGSGSLSWVDLAAIVGTTPYERLLPVEGGSHTIQDGVGALVINMNISGALSAYTVTMPANPLNGQTVYITANNDVTSFTLLPNAGQSIVDPPLDLGVSERRHAAFIFDTTDQIWFRVD